MASRKENGIFVVKEKMEVNSYDFDGTADELKANIDLIVEKARAKGMVGEGCFDFGIESLRYCDDYDIKVNYYFDRVENDREKSVREQMEAIAKKRAAEKRKATTEKKKLKADAEYAEFLRLKEKFKDIENA